MHYVGNILKGDLGTSYITRRSIVSELRHRFPATLRLALAAMLFAITIGLAVGIYGAWRPGRWVDRFLTLGAYLGVSFPVYWVGLVLILVFAVQLRWLPPSGSWGFVYLVLPAMTLGMRSVAVIARMTRAAMQEVLQSDFIRTARAKGLGEARVVLRHGLRNALLPVITVLGLDFGSYLTGLHPDGDHLLLARRRALRAHRHREARPPRGPGQHPVPERRVRARQPGDRPALCESRSEGLV